MHPRFCKTLPILLAFALPQAVSAQTVTTPPRSITSQQETPGVDSTFQGNVQPNTVGSGFTVPIPGAPSPPPPPPPPPPPVTCTASSSSKTVTQAASCPAGYLTTAGSSTFTQSATQTTTTACPSGAYGSPSTSTSTGAWSPTPAAACTVSTVNYLTFNGKSYLALCAPKGSGGTWSCVAEIYIEFDPSGTYEVVRDVNTKTTTVASGTWLPAGGGAASNYVIAAATAVSQNSNGTNGSVSFNNTIGSGVSLGSIRSIGISTSFLYRAPSLPSNVSGGSGAETINFTIKNTTNGTTLIGTLNITAQAYASGG